MNKYFLFRLQVEYVMPFINKYIIKIKLHDHHFIKLEAQFCFFLDLYCQVLR